jgi:hypothetical protein
MSLASQPSAIGVDTVDEARTLSRLLCAISLSSNLQDALMRFYSFLPARESLGRTAVVLALLDDFLPSEMTAKLKATRSFSSTESTPPSSFSASLTIPVLIILSSIVVALTIVGAFTTYGFIASRIQ